MPAPAPSATVAPGGRSTEFVPVTGGEATTSAGTMLVAAYLLMWLLVLAFVLLTFKRLLNLSGRVDSLEKGLREEPPEENHP